MIPKNDMIYRIKLIYIFTYLVLSLLFLKMLYVYIAKSFFDQDLLWFVPAVLRSTKGLSFGELIGYFLNPFPLQHAMPILKIYTYFILSLFCSLAKYFISVSIIFHFANSFLLFLLGKNLGLNSRISFLSSLMYLTIFAHFHAYMWPMVFMHLATIFFILLVLIFYLKTDNLIGNNLKFRRFYILTLCINFFAPLCRLSILSLPVMILTHILFCSKDKEQRLRKYKIWMPLFATYLIYPLLLISCGEFRFKALLGPLIAKFGFVFKNTLLYSFFANINIVTKFFILFLIGLCFLYAFKILLVIHSNFSLKKSRVFKRAFIIMIALACIILIIDGGPKRLMIPYNTFAPFVGTVSTFLEPLDNAMFIDSTRANYSIPLQLNVFNFLLAFFILFLFLKNFLFKQKQLAILLVFYLFNVPYVYLLQSIPSRHYIYLSPIFCIIFCCAFDSIFSYYMNQTKFKIVTKEIILCLIFVILCIPNLLAIKLSLFRGKAVNSFFSYDYIRGANIIKPDLIKNKEKVIYVNGIIPVTFPATEDSTITVAPDPYNDNARLVLKQVFDDPFIVIKLNQEPSEEKVSIYFLDGYMIKNAKGRNIDMFSRFFEKAREQLMSNRYREAEDLFMAAIKERPFLLNYILPGLRLEDLRWITGGIDARTWLNKMENFYSAGFDEVSLSRNRYILSIMNKEVDEYIKCLFYISFLKHISGDIHASRQWFLKIRFLDSDFKRLRSCLAETPSVKSDKRILSFLDSLDNASLYVGPDDYRDRYIFERFMFNLAFNKP